MKKVSFSYLFFLFISLNSFGMNLDTSISNHQTSHFENLPIEVQNEIMTHMFFENTDTGMTKPKHIHHLKLVSKEFYKFYTDFFKLKTLNYHDDFVNSAEFSKNGKHVLSFSKNGGVKVWNANTGEEVLALLGHESFISSAHYSNDGLMIVTASSDFTAKIWDAQTGKMKHDLVGHTNAVHYASFSYDNQLVATVSVDKTARIWDVESGKIMKTLDLNDFLSASCFVTFSQDGKFILTTSSREANVWDINNSELITTLKEHGSDIVSGQFSSDGSKIVTGSFDGKAKIWDAHSGKIIFTLTNYDDDQFRMTDSVYCVQFSADNRQVLTASGDHIRIWNVHSGNLIAILKGHTTLISSAYYSSDQNKIISASYDKTIKIWDIKKFMNHLK